MGQKQKTGEKKKKKREDRKRLKVGKNATSGGARKAALGLDINVSSDQDQENLFNFGTAVTISNTIL